MPAIKFHCLLLLYIQLLVPRTQMQLIYADQAWVLQCSLSCQPLWQQKLQINYPKGRRLDKWRLSDGEWARLRGTQFGNINHNKHSVQQ